MSEFTETPARLTRGIEITVVRTGRHYTLCKPCFLKEYEIDESSLSTATAQPQPDLLVEKYLALTGGGTCRRCKAKF